MRGRFLWGVGSALENCIRYFLRKDRRRSDEALRVIGVEAISSPGNISEGAHEPELITGSQKRSAFRVQLHRWSTTASAQIRKGCVPKRREFQMSEITSGTREARWSSVR